MPRLSKAKVAELVVAAHEHGLRIFAHVSQPEHVVDAVAGGIDGVMHSSEGPIPDTVLEEMARREVFYVATLSLYDGFIDHAFGRFDQEPFAVAGVSPRALTSLEDEGWRSAPFDTPEEALAIQAALYDNLRRAVAAGVPLALGTDVNNPTVFPGYSAHEELALMVEAGLTPAQALTAATQGGAAFLEKETSLGRIAPGYAADLLLLTGNPLEDILHTRTLHTVIHHGHVVEGVVTASRPGGGS
jgi:imidazolonepropionase-like amidohydrolase